MSYFKCDKCDDIIDHFWQMVIHMKGLTIRYFKCDKCDDIIAKFWQMVKHIEIDHEFL